MSLLQARGIAKSFGSRLILDGLDLDIEPGVRMGVIGPNGGGKSTLLRILAGEETADAGEVTQRRGLVVAFLPQQLEGDDARRARRRCAPRGPTSTSSRHELAHGRARSSAKPGADLDRMARLLRRQEDAARTLDRGGRAGFDGRARALLADVGLDDDDLGEADPRPLRRAAQARRARRVPLARPRRAAARRARGAPRRRGARADRSA